MLSEWTEHCQILFFHFQIELNKDWNKNFALEFAFIDSN